jgi:hypothetical protein
VIDTSNNVGTTFYINGSNITLKNFSNIQSTMTAFLISGNSNGVTIDGGTTLQPDGAWTKQFLVIANGAQNVTFSNYTIGNLTNGAAAKCAGAAVCFAPNGNATAVTTNTVIDNVTFTSTASSTNTTCTTANSAGCVNNSIAVYDATVNVNTLDIGNSTFSNLNKGAVTDPVVFAGVLGMSLASLNFHDNTVTNTSATGCTAALSYNCALIVLPTATTTDTVYLTGSSYIQNNQFHDDVALGQLNAIYWRGPAYTAGSTLGSNLYIQDNDFAGFTAAAINITYGGLVTVQRNTFQTSTYGNPNTMSEETGTNTGAMFVNGTTTTNNAIRTWYPTAAVIAGPSSACVATLTVAAPTANMPPVPVTLDVFWTASHTAEVYVGRVTGVRTTNSTVTVPVPTALLGADGTLSGLLRLQTQTSGATGTFTQPESSQYSRTVAITGVCQSADFSVRKIAYADDAYTQPIPAGAPLAAGTDIYFAFVLTNLSATDSTVVTAVTDALAGPTPICSNITLAPGQVDATSCRWHTTAVVP